MIRNDRIPTNSKSNTPCADSNLEPQVRVAARSKGLPRLRPRDEARKLEIRRVGGGIGGSKSGSKGERSLEPQMNEVPDFCDLNGWEKTILVQM
ncbi:hypothetical protein AVEN_12767-1 [Araneus ventricosus]|uniref:Uncharacterized protein n=1 Tax=Araneus ventricosus TaxID=182803 RepID=A0A4Y2ABA9_ARAVE|nr:hypothetical protein AVEN_12767-1 [Araneus ventricosus]